jgi:hypothetical protein
MALSCAIFSSCSSELEPTVAPITIVDDCSHLTLNSVVEINKIANNTGISSYSKFNGFHISAFFKFKRQ